MPNLVVSRLRSYTVFLTLAGDATVNTVDILGHSRVLTRSDEVKLQIVQSFISHGIYRGFSKATSNYFIIARDVMSVSASDLPDAAAAWWDDTESAWETGVLHCGL